ncbi:hypothetical protein DFH11DRAFT_1733894 [Phellopilus nigrolimitatus]|nr:hypothetical protein DFH11DRAFT_1733894 [Phellopilus nigrolimitatus]
MSSITTPATDQSSVCVSAPFVCMSPSSSGTSIGSPPISMSGSDDETSPLTIPVSVSPVAEIKPIIVDAATINKTLSVTYKAVYIYGFFIYAATIDKTPSVVNEEAVYMSGFVIPGVNDSVRAPSPNLAGLGPVFSSLEYTEPAITTTASARTDNAPVSTIRDGDIITIDPPAVSEAKLDPLEVSLQAFFSWRSEQTVLSTLRSLAPRPGYPLRVSMFASMSSLTAAEGSSGDAEDMTRFIYGFLRIYTRNAMSIPVRNLITQPAFVALFLVSGVICHRIFTDEDGRVVFTPVSVCFSGTTTSFRVFDRTIGKPVYSTYTTGVYDPVF